MEFDEQQWDLVVRIAGLVLLPLFRVFAIRIKGMQEPKTLAKLSIALQHIRTEEP